MMDWLSKLSLQCLLQSSLSIILIAEPYNNNGKLHEKTEGCNRSRKRNDRCWKIQVIHWRGLQYNLQCRCWVYSTTEVIIISIEYHMMLSFNFAASRARRVYLCPVKFPIVIVLLENFGKFIVVLPSWLLSVYQYRYSVLFFRYQAVSGIKNYHFMSISIHCSCFCIMYK